jgi:hypothetical protein
MYCGAMEQVEATRSGIAGCYLSRVQMTALLQVADEEGLARQQIIKRAILRELVAAGKLDQVHLDAAIAKQEVLAKYPHTNLKPVSELRMGKGITEEEVADRGQKAATAASMARTAENLRRIQKGMPTIEEEEAAKEQERPRRRRRRPRE